MVRRRVVKGHLRTRNSTCTSLDSLRHRKAECARRPREAEPGHQPVAERHGVPPRGGDVPERPGARRHKRQHRAAVARLCPRGRRWPPVAQDIERAAQLERRGRQRKQCAWRHLACRDESDERHVLADERRGGERPRAFVADEHGQRVNALVAALVELVDVLAHDHAESAERDRYRTRDLERRDAGCCGPAAAEHGGAPHEQNQQLAKPERLRQRGVQQRRRQTERKGPRTRGRKLASEQRRARNRGGRDGAEGETEIALANEALRQWVCAVLQAEGVFILVEAAPQVLRVVDHIMREVPQDQRDDPNQRSDETGGGAGCTGK
eukprot:scaffold50375_cov59-Phaeocystis_antarctica.AAC.3